jgi:para-nitrobenzyl esterase
MSYSKRWAAEARAKVASAIATFSLILATAQIASAQMMGHPIVQTLDGKVQGSAFKDHVEFLGIPFAAPPVGKLRFEPPAPPTPWKGVLKTQAFKSSCPQPPGFLGNIASNNEDCLYLNVYTPPNVQQPLPVMIWIHGGGYVAGGAATYISSALANHGNIIVVTIQYRLNVFGFLASTSLSKTAAGGTSGNYGFEDQQAALAWVIANIAAFGGDPSHVTIAGESAGAGSVTNHLVAPGSQGFAGAIGESAIAIGRGLLGLEKTLGDAETAGDKFVTAVKCD